MSGAPVILIIGASGGIGSATAELLGQQNFRLILSSRNQEKLDSVAAKYNTLKIKCDATDEASVADLMDRALQTHGRVDGIIHAVGSMLLKPAHITTLEEFTSTLTTNLISSFLILKHGAKAMFGSGGSMVFFSTVATGIGLPNHEAIGAAKAGIDGLVISAAATYASKNIRVNAVAPGLTNTPLASRITGNDASLKASVALHPLGRIGNPEDIASAAAWLVDPGQSWITGQIIRVDGGLSAVRGR
ncbi:MAG TPA: SDR family oxidoreductase [Kiritimatiellia bacterium]|nr:SDR family oxidoreductase [Kiritimatiellia bacterium]